MQSGLSSASLPRIDTKGAHHANRKSQGSGWGARSSLSCNSNKKTKSQHFVNTDIVFKNQSEIDNFNNVRWGYKSKMNGFEEDHLVKLLKHQYKLESELEMQK
jgi:hypothetical protein